jgi:hypothetical protein
VIEWPFVVVGMEKGRKGAWRTLKASLLANAASYVLLAGLYGMMMNISLVTVPTFVDKGLAKDPTAVVYFVDGKDHGVYRMRLDGTGRERVGTWVIEDYRDRLQLLRAEDGKTMDVRVVNDSGGTSVVVAGVMESEGLKADDVVVRFINNGPAVDLRGEGKRDWEVRTGFWPGEGLRAENASTGEVMRLAFESPLLSWWSGCATILPGDQVVYEVEGQVMLLDLGTKRMLFLARGSNPVAVIPKD